MNFAQSTRITLFASMTTILLANAGASRAQEPLFRSPWRAFDTGDFPTFAPAFFALGDINDDGITDIVAAREYFGGPGLSVVRGLGGGVYAAEEIYELDLNMDLGEVELADIDSDGDLDAVTSIKGGSGLGLTIGLWRNDGTGAFSQPEEFFTGEGPVGLVIDDFTGDGFPDAITADQGYVAGDNDTISLLEHNGLTGDDAGFLAPVAFQVAPNCERLDAADVDDDGDLDLVVGRGAVHIMLNDGAGQFSMAQTIEESVPDAYTQSVAVHLADVDNDGDADLLSGGATNGVPAFGKVAIRRNDGTGVFGSPEVHSLGEGTFTPWQIRTGDLNADGWLDIVVTTPSGRALDGYNVVMNNGSGSFSTGTFYKAAKQTFDVALFDADNNGTADVLTVANDSSAITVHPNPGDGVFFEPEVHEVGTLIADLIHGDIDNDGDFDLATAGGNDVHILRNNGDGAFPPAEQFNSPFNPNDILFADMNNDGWLDLVTRNYDFAVALNDGEGEFNPAVLIPVGSSQAGEVGAFDLDNDGDLDIVANDPGPASQVYLFENLGNGTSFTLANIIADSDGLPFGVGGGDIDHDGNIDLVFNNALGLTVYLGNGDFTVGDPFPTSEYGYPFMLDDVDDDGNLDLAFKMPEEYGTVEVGVMLGYGDGGFTFADTYPGPSGRESAFRVTSDVDVADVNGDGMKDVIFTNNAPCDVSLFFGNSDGTLQPQERYGVGYSASDSAIADFTGDGVVDIASVIGLPPSGISDGVVFLEGLGDSGSQNQPADLADVEVVFGLLLDGGLAELEESDDAEIHTRSRPGFFATEPNVMEMIVGATSPLNTPGTIDITIESRINHPTGTAKVRLRDWSSGQLDEVGQFDLGTSETVEMLEGIDATDYVRASDNRIELSLKHIVVATFTASGFDSFIDQTLVEVE